MKKSLRIFENKLIYPVLLLAAAALWGSMRASGRRAVSGLITYTVAHRDMTVSVIEGGNLIALRSQRIINEVPGNRTVLEAIDDGTHITEADIERGRVLLRMDSKDLEDRLEQLKLNVENSWANYMEAEQRLEMQKKQNESDLAQAQLKVKFTEMDLKKYLGDELASEMIEKGEADMPRLLESEELGGSALNRKRTLAANIDIAREHLTRAQDRADWSRQLAERGYITQSELQADLLSVRQREVELDRAQLEHQLFLDYDFPKEVEKHFSDYKESLRELERVVANCAARLIQAETSLASRKAQYELNRNSMEEVEEQIKKCTIVATQVGFVTTPTPTHRWRTQEPIQPGTVVRRHQELFSVPDFRSMGVQVNIHEASVRKLSPGQRAVIRVDAFPDVRFTGTVRRIAHMPDPSLQFLNPDINVYATTLALDNTHDYLRPGMAAQVEIIISELKNVLAIPVDAVLFRDGEPYAVVAAGGELVERRIEIGESSETMVEVKNGLQTDETIVIQPRMVASQIRQIELEEKGRFEEPDAPAPPAEFLQAPRQEPSADSATETPARRRTQEQRRERPQE